MIKLVFRLFVAAVLAVPLSAAARPGDDGEGEPASPLSGWRVGPVATIDGGVLYCVAESRFDNGQSLVIARSRRGEINIGIGAPAAHLTKGAAWPVTVMVDTDFKRDRKAVAADADMLVIANGADSRLVEALTQGGTLTIRGPKDTVAFRLKDTSKAMPDLTTCVDQVVAGKPPAPLGSVASSPRQLPPALKRLLAEAGFRKIGLMAGSAAPQGLGPADYVWKTETVTAGMTEFRPEPGRSLASLGDDALARLRPRCSGHLVAKDIETENLPGGSFRLVDVDCAPASGTGAQIAFLFELGRGGLFKQFFFESASASAAGKDRGAIADVLKQIESR